MIHALHVLSSLVLNLAEYLAFVALNVCNGHDCFVGVHVTQCGQVPLIKALGLRE